MQEGYACQNPKSHCCSMIPTDPKIEGSMKMCMQKEGVSPFGQWSWETDKMNFKYTCPTFLDNCTTDSTCAGSPGQTHCWTLRAQNPAIDTDIKMCMSSLGAVTGSWNHTEDDGKINYKYKCPVAVLNNCTTDAETDCEYRSPYCCKMTTTEYATMPVEVNQKFKMCMNSPKFSETEVLKDSWDDPTNAASFDYDCDPTPFNVPTSAFDEFFDYAINYKEGNNVKKLTKAGLPYDQCGAKKDFPEKIKD